ncbi:MAG: hypothetical protein NTU76_02510 [Candidatus Taylorbacteria bacterium]|nr:hypothetical protein [Candidatus Taylorbacteria bacterium]
MNNGNVSGQYVELLRTVVGKLPRDFGWADLDWLTHHTNELGQFLDGMKKIVPTRFDFEVPVFYGPLEEVMEFCGVINTCSAIDSEHIFDEPKGEKVKKISIFRCKLENVDVCLKENGLRPASLCEVVNAARIPFIKHCYVVSTGLPFCFENQTIQRVPYVYPHHSGESCVSVTAKEALSDRIDFFFAGVAD